jgi:endonuclease/exonuclease/phosphatase family metal-dependent hydrolase
MSFNIRCANCDDGIHSWQNRKSRVVERIRIFQPDLLGIQECREDSQAEYLRANLPEYHFFGVPRGGGGDTALEMAPLMVRRSAFQVLEAGCFWLSPKPEVPGSLGWDAVFARTATWIRLQFQASGKSLTFINTHFDYQPAAIDGAAALMQNWLKQAAVVSPVILTGDFNADKNSKAYQQLTAGGFLCDVLRQGDSGGMDLPTFHGFGHPSGPLAIDWILASPRFKVLTASVDTFHEGNSYPSDHFPIRAELED